ncbi:MAG: tripartite tricarboxylate transporter substrate binding protein [Betaproteobacteria bacterium]
MPDFSIPLLARCLAVASTVVAPGAGLAQAFPAKPVRMVIGFPAGSSSDVVGRLVAQKMSEGLGQQVIFENRPGAGGNIGAEFIAKSPADGYLLLYANTGLAVAVSAYEKLGYDALRDLVPVGQAVAGPHLLIVNVSLPVQSVRDLIALAKAKPRGYNVASSGNGNSDHFAYELFRSITGAEMVHVPYKGGGQASVDVIAGQMACYFSGMAAGLPLVRSGKVKGLAVTTAQRSQIAPDIPTMVEAGVPGYEHVLWNAVLAPAGTPKNVVARLDAELAKAVNAPELRERFATLGVEPYSRNSEQMTIYLKAEVDKYAKIVKAIGLKIE